MIMDIQNALPLQIERDQPIRFTDAFGRVMPIHLELVDSKEVAHLFGSSRRAFTKSLISGVYRYIGSKVSRLRSLENRE
jgi:hypothetical protein